MFKFWRKVKSKPTPPPPPPTLISVLEDFKEGMIALDDYEAAIVIMNMIDVVKIAGTYGLSELSCLNAIWSEIKKSTEEIKAEIAPTPSTVKKWMEL